MTKSPPKQNQETFQTYNDEDTNLFWGQCAVSQLIPEWFVCFFKRRQQPTAQAFVGADRWVAELERPQSGQIRNHLNHRLADLKETENFWKLAMIPKRSPDRKFISFVDLLND